MTKWEKLDEWNVVVLDSGPTQNFCFDSEQAALEKWDELYAEGHSKIDFAQAARVDEEIV